MTLQMIGAAALIVLGAALDARATVAGEPRHLTEVGLCRVPPGTGICTCSLSSIETQLTFGEAASTVELFYRDFPDESYVNLLVSLLKQCSGEPPSAPTQSRMLLNIPISAPAR
jgi:hypothetical protein